jgi:hypothetical protein
MSRYMKTQVVYYTDYFILLIFQPTAFMLETPSPQLIQTHFSACTFPDAIPTIM